MLQEDFSFLPDKPDKKEEDLSFLPDKPLPTEEPWYKKAFEWGSTPLTTIPGRIEKALAPIVMPQTSQGMVDVGANLANSFTTPINIGMAALTGGESLVSGPALKGLQFASRLASIPFTLEGAKNVYEGKTLPEKGMGALELAGGLFGMKSRAPRIEGTPQIKPEVPKVAPAIDVSPKSQIYDFWKKEYDTWNLGDLLGVKDDFTGKKSFKTIVSQEKWNAQQQAFKDALREKKPKLRITTSGKLEPISLQEHLSELPDQPVTAPKYEMKGGVWQKVGEQPQEERDVVKEFIKSEEGSFDPNIFTTKIKGALLKAQQGPTKYNPTEVNPETQGTVGKLFAAIEEARSLRPAQAELYSIERGKRAAAYMNMPDRAKDLGQTAKGALAGELPKIGMEPLKLGKKDIYVLGKTITNSMLRPYEQQNAMDAVRNLLEGQLPKPSSMKLLDAAFGKGFSNTIIELHGGLGAIPIKKEIVADLLNVPRALKTAYDLSAPFRQGLGLVNRKEFWNAFIDMNKGLGSKEAYDTTMDAIFSKPLFQSIGNKKSFAEQVGLQITDMMSHPEEAYISRAVQWLPGMQRSERAYLGFLNKLRADTFETLINQAKAAGRNPEQDLVLARQIADYVNNATGRGKLPDWAAKNSDILNGMFFSPRFIASRLRMLNPNTYRNADPFVRKQYLKSLRGIGAVGATVLGAGKLGGGEIETDPHSSDFMKLKIGNTRIDPWGGFQQYIVGFVNQGQLMKDTLIDQKKSVFGSTPPAEKFLYYKMAPVASETVRLLFGRDPVSGQPLTLPRELEQSLAPMFLDDMIQVIREEPDAWPSIPLTLYGMGGQTYEARKSTNMALRMPSR